MRTASVTGITLGVSPPPPSLSLSISLSRSPSWGLQRQIQAYQKIMDRYDIPREEADAIIHHLDASEGF